MPSTFQARSGVRHLHMTMALSVATAAVASLSRGDDGRVRGTRRDVREQNRRNPARTLSGMSSADGSSMFENLRDMGEKG